MIEHNVLDDIDIIVEFYIKSTHATTPNKGIDAIEYLNSTKKLTYSQSENIIIFMR